MGNCYFTSSPLSHFAAKGAQRQGKSAFRQAGLSNTFDILASWLSERIHEKGHAEAEDDRHPGRKKGLVGGEESQSSCRTHGQGNNHKAKHDLDREGPGCEGASHGLQIQATLRAVYAVQRPVVWSI